MKRRQPNVVGFEMQKAEEEPRKVEGSQRPECTRNIFSPSAPIKEYSPMDALILAHKTHFKIPTSITIR